MPAFRTVVSALMSFVVRSFCRRRGHHLKDGLDIYRDVRELQRDNRAGDVQGHMNQDQSWTFRSRQTTNRP
jgi:hypothetical protein